MEPVVPPLARSVRQAPLRAQPDKVSVIRARRGRTQVVWAPQCVPPARKACCVLRVAQRGSNRFTRLQHRRSNERSYVVYSVHCGHLQPCGIYGMLCMPRGFRICSWSHVVHRMRRR